jgi:ribosome biogenesis GTPase A
VDYFGKLNQKIAFTTGKGSGNALKSLIPSVLQNFNKQTNKDIHILVIGMPNVGKVTILLNKGFLRFFRAQ